MEVMEGYQFATTSPQFEISEVTIAGNQTLPDKELRTWLGSVTGENIFLLNLEDLSSRLVRHPWIQTVSVRKVFPKISWSRWRKENLMPESGWMRFMSWITLESCFHLRPQSIATFL